MSEDPPETVVQELIEFVHSNGGDGVVSRDHTFNLSDGVRGRLMRGGLK